MGLSNFLLPERLPRQVIYAGDRHAGCLSAEQRITSRRRVPGARPGRDIRRAGRRSRRTACRRKTQDHLQRRALRATIFEFDKLPWQKKALRELVAWRLQKVFPESSDAYDHRFLPIG